MKEIISNLAAILSILSFLIALGNKMNLAKINTAKKRQIKHLPVNVGVY